MLYIVLGGVCDGFDGRIARATGTGSRFGVELDSLVDAISFGLAPAMIIYYSVLDHEGGAWWLLVFLFTACAVIRLARFNVMQGGNAPSGTFQGLPSPAAGGTLATYYWFSQSAFYTQTRDRGSAVARHDEGPHGRLAILMITNVPYPAFPKVGVRSWSGLAGLVVVVGSICGIFNYGREFFFPAGMAYVLYGLAGRSALGLVDRIPTGRRHGR